MKYIELFKNGFDDTITDKTKPGNYPYVGYSPNLGFAFSMIPKSEGTYYDIRILKKTNIPVITYGEVDLCLPNGTIWSDRNVGANTPHDYGAYFSWGSTSGVNITIDKWLEDDIIRIILIEEEDVPADAITQEMIDTVKLEVGENLKAAIEEYLTEYCLISGTIFNWETTPYYRGISVDNTHLFAKYNDTDGLTVLEAIDDAATVNMGDGWRMPTIAEMRELVENTDHYYIGEDSSIVAGPFDYETNYSDKGLDGNSKLHSICFVKKGESFNYDVRSNFIEFPFAGGCDGSLLAFMGLSGVYWASSVYSDNTEAAGGLGFYNGGSLDNDNPGARFYGCSVRGVRT